MCAFWAKWNLYFFFLFLFSLPKTKKDSVWSFKWEIQAELRLPYGISWIPCIINCVSIALRGVSCACSRALDPLRDRPYHLSLSLRTLSSLLGHIISARTYRPSLDIWSSYSLAHNYSQTYMITLTKPLRQQLLNIFVCRIEPPRRKH